MYVYDPQFAYRHFAIESLDVRLKSFHVQHAAALSPDDGNLRLRLLGGYRPFDPEDSPSFVEAQVGYAHHRFGPEGFSADTLELFALGRLDLEWLDPQLRGSFAELGAGVALRSVVYQLPGDDLREGEELLLGRFSFGFALDGAGSELEAFYDHRHDDYAAGLEVSGLGSGVAGHFGLGARYFFDERWGLRAGAQIGSALLSSLSIVFRERHLP
jgi:hypothetical protein